MIIFGVVIFFVIVFIFFLVLIKRALTFNVTTATAHLSQISEDYLKKQAEVKARLDEAQFIYQKKLTEAQEESNKLKTAMINEVNQQKEKLLSEARVRGEEIIKQGEQTRQSLILDMEKNIKIKAKEMTPQLISEVLDTTICEKIHDYLMDEFITGSLDKMKQLDVENISQIDIFSAFALRDSQQKAILAAIKKNTGKDFDLSCVIQKDLIAGLVIKIGSIVVDASLKWRIKQKAKDMVV